MTQIRTLEASGFGVGETAERLGIHRTTVSRYRIGPKTGPFPRTSPEKIAEIRRLRKAGLTTVEICKRLNTTRQTVIKYAGTAEMTDWKETRRKLAELEAQGIFDRRKQSEILGVHMETLRKRYGPRLWFRLKAKDFQRIRQRYLNGESTQDLADEFGCSRSTIYKVIHKQGRFEFL